MVKACSEMVVGVAIKVRALIEVQNRVDRPRIT